MCLFLVCFWFSRFGEFNSRLGPQNSRLGSLREFARNALISLVVFETKLHFCGENRKIPSSTGITGNLAGRPRRGWLTLPGRLDHVAVALVHLQPP